MPAAQAFPCADCHGVRLHAILVYREIVNGHLVKVTRIRSCTACQKRSPLQPKAQPGIACPKCGDCRLTVKYTRHRGPGVTVRVRRCVGCGHQIRTAEVVESYAHRAAS